MSAINKTFFQSKFEGTTIAHNQGVAGLYPAVFNDIKQILPTNDKYLFDFTIAKSKQDKGPFET